ncbi:outer membrane protein [Candidatus Uabimicrobium sp. HlEnr_7]|uniref:outer membrane protein n=1 Tax=Candidatus Uabimicrobium helgolandensis TaxID=3095367 RepID=UPI00355642CF
MLKVYYFVLSFIFLLPLHADSDVFTLDEIQYLNVKSVDVRSVGVGFIGRFFHEDLLSFDAGADTINQIEDVEDKGQGGIQFSFRYGLDNYLFPGISLGLKFDYIYANIDNVNLLILDNDIIDFELVDTGFFTAHSFSIIPNIELSLFNLAENLFSFDISSYWDIYIYTGIRLSYNIYDENNDLDDQNLNLKGLNNFVYGFEFGLGTEVFFNYVWSIKLEYSYSTQNTDFDIIEGNENKATVDFDMITSKVVLGINYYF